MLENWKTAGIIQMFLIGLESEGSLENFRPVSLNSLLGKLVESKIKSTNYDAFKINLAERNSAWSL